MTNPWCRNHKVAIFILLLFTLAISFPFGWFYCSDNGLETRNWIELPTKLPEWQFTSLELPRGVREKIRADKYINGMFQNKDNSIVRIFMAEWLGRQDLSVITHTPDQCWPLSGWMSIPVDLPTTTNITIGKDLIGVQVRLFHHTASGENELVVWLTNINGQLFSPRDFRFGIDSIDMIENSLPNSSSRRLRINYFANAIFSRTPSINFKQFLRFSTPIKLSAETTLNKIKAFIESSIVINTY